MTPINEARNLDELGSPEPDGRPLAEEPAATMRRARRSRRKRPLRRLEEYRAQSSKGEEEELKALAAERARRAARAKGARGLVDGAGGVVDDDDDAELEGADPDERSRSSAGRRTTRRCCTHPAAARRRRGRERAHELGGEGRFLDKNSGFMYLSHYELGPHRGTKLAVRARREDDGTRLARMQVEYQAERGRSRPTLCRDGTGTSAPTRLPAHDPQGGQPAAEEAVAYAALLSETAADLARQGIIKVTNGRDGRSAISKRR